MNVLDILLEFLGLILLERSRFQIATARINAHLLWIRHRAVKTLRGSLLNKQGLDRRVVLSSTARIYGSLSQQLRSVDAGRGDLRAFVAISAASDAPGESEDWQAGTP